MCRLFGFKSVITGQVHQSLLNADNALRSQSTNHPDGWGLAYFIEGAPHVIKSTDMANTCQLFNKVSAVVTSKTVLAHVRKSTIGDIDLLNTHPFQYGPWVFAHNGNIKNFTKHRDNLMTLILPQMRNHILGTTDSEILFYILMSYFEKTIGIQKNSTNFKKGAPIIRKALEDIMKIVGSYSCDEGTKETYLSFILSNGKTMFAHHGGKKLFFSTYKNRCGERETCEKFAEICEAPSPTGKVNHLIISSEPTTLENIWEELQPGEIIGIDDDLIYSRDRISQSGATN